MNRQIGVGDSKYVIVFDPLLTGHVIRRMRSGRVRIFNANQWETLRADVKNDGELVSFSSFIVVNIDGRSILAKLSVSSSMLTVNLLSHD